VATEVKNHLRGLWREEVGERAHVVLNRKKKHRAHTAADGIHSCRKNEMRRTKDFWGRRGEMH